MFKTGGTTVTKNFDGIQAIYAVKESDMLGTAEEVANRLYISLGDYTDFKEYYNANKKFCTVYLFRYRVSDYVAQEATLFKRDKFLGITTWEKKDTNAYFFQETVNLDFDIIDVTFSNGRKDTIIPVVANPIDVIPSPTPPVYTQSDKEPNWWLIIAGIILLIMAVIYLPQILIGLIKGVLGLIGKLLKGIWSILTGDRGDKG